MFEYYIPHKYIVNPRNRRLSEHVQMTLNTRHTDLNNNVLVIGGSGAGKSFRFVIPNTLQLSSSFIFTDPKGELREKLAPFLSGNGYKVRSIDLRDAQGMKRSTHYNPFSYVKTQEDIMKLITNLMTNTTKKDAKADSPFWESAEGMGLQALFYYVWLEGVEHPDTHEIMHNLWAVMELLKMAELKEDPATGERLESDLDILMAELESRDPGHIAVIQYNKVMRGAADTVRSIITTMNARLASLQNDTVLEMLWDDEMDFGSFGTEKSALFCVIPDNDKTFNYIIGLLYTQMFQELYLQADNVFHGALPVHVTFMLDEFSNVALPDDFCSLLSTMRSREISSIIIIQNLAQIKALFKDTWESLCGNCDTTIYLGGNEQSSFKYLSEILGEATIEKRSMGESMGSQSNSSSRNYDILGRKLMLESEIRKLPRDKCIVCIRGFDPILDQKIQTNRHPLYRQMLNYAKKGYSFDARLERASKRSIENKVYHTSELLHYLSKDQAEMEQYQQELSIARKTGDEEPAPPVKRVIDLPLFDFLSIDIDALEPEKLSMEFNNSVIENNLKREMSEREEESVQIKNLDMKEAGIYLDLSRSGFSVAQIKIILDIYKGSSYFSEKEIVEKFTPAQSEEDLLAFKELFLTASPRN
ncbi:MAG: type IV secretory system conjugative DNA transfer family protein [Clostridiaceae bacterium]|nr:type IV secretory system conjugative DNA transfer family protein [Clostridiaceae bacterium]